MLKDAYNTDNAQWWRSKAVVCVVCNTTMHDWWTHTTCTTLTVLMKSNVVTKVTQLQLCTLETEWCVHLSQEHCA